MKKTNFVLKIMLPILSLIIIFSSCYSNEYDSTMHTHQWIAATCKAPKTCMFCKETEGLPLEHTIVTDNAVPATCTKQGFTEGTHCEVCNEILIQQQEINPLEHDFDRLNSRECLRCGYEEPKPISVISEYNYGTKIYGQLTYQKNTYLNTQGDNGAIIILIPVDKNVKSFDNEKAAKFIMGKYASGIFVTKCDGYGNFDFGNSVSTGDYIFLGISSNVLNNTRIKNEDAWQKNFLRFLGNYFSEKDVKTLSDSIGNYAWCWDTISVKADCSQKITHDFGYTHKISD